MQMRLSRKTFAWGLAGVAVVAAVTAGSAPAERAATPAPVTLADALKVSHRLGPVAGGQWIHLSLGLRGRHAAELQRLMDQGRSVDPHALATRYGPNPARLHRVLASLRSAGFSTRWQRGEQIAYANAPARVVERTFRVKLDRYVTPQGRRFYAPRHQPGVPRLLRPLVTAVLGLDDFIQIKMAAIRPGGTTPTDVASFYGIKALHNRGLDGSGQTVAFNEVINPAELAQLKSDLAAYSRRFNLPPADLSMRLPPAGVPIVDKDTSEQNGYLSEAALDVQVVHAIAPKAKLVIYIMPQEISDESIRMEMAMVNANRRGIISDSWGFCESAVPNARVARLLAQPWVRTVALDVSHFVASGDDGAYQCSQAKPPAVWFAPATCAATGVGGTSVFLSRSGDYYREAAWGNPISEAGGGGGISHWFLAPAWQRAPGVKQALARGHCQVPDVSALADSNTGWAILFHGKWTQIGGTSAAAPLWAGMTALFNQHLKSKGLRPVGFANPGLYWIAAHASQFNPRPFHDVTEGTNLLYWAKSGWDFATGLGTPNAPGLLAAWETYRRTAGR